MAKQLTITEKVERRTYLKGKFIGKFIGSIDFHKSDKAHENFYDIEVLSGQIFTNKTNFRIWEDGGEHEEFIDINKFLTKLPETLPCSVTYPDNSVKHFHINLLSPKLDNYSLTNQVNEGNKMFGDIIGDISGYLLHYDTIEKIIDVDDENEIEEVKINEPPKAGSDLKSKKEEVKNKKGFRGFANIGCGSILMSMLGWAYLIFIIYSLVSIFIRPNNHSGNNYPNNRSKTQKYNEAPKSPSKQEINPPVITKESSIKTYTDTLSFVYFPGFNIIVL